MQVKVSEGILEGEVLDNVLGGKYYSFKGVPYAAPPVGELRFKEPQPPKSWNGVRSAKQHGSVCHQFDMFTRTIMDGSEDCLYLNIYTPNLKPTNLLPVMFWIHGGGFISGSGNSDYYGPDFLVHKDVILVTINYRLEVLGFLCLNTENVPGNAGMKDQVAALRWVRKNISNFGGNPDNVTIFGESVGSTSVAFHLISPLTKGLFKRAIMQSGEHTNIWAAAREARLRAENLARQLGCNSNDDKELYEFFKSVPIDKLIAVKAPITIEESTNMKLTISFTVVDEGDFGSNERYFYGDVYKKLLSGIHEEVEVMIGYTTHEGALTTVFIRNPLNVYNTLLQLFVPPHMLNECSIGKQLEVGRKMKDYYFGGDVNSGNVDRLVDFMSFDSFVYNILRWAKMCTKKNPNAVYLYKFDCYSERNIFAELFSCDIKRGKRSVSHCDDLMYLFPMEKFKVPLNKDSKSYKMILHTTKLWTDFAKFGNPTPDNSLGVQWPTFDEEKQAYMIIGDELILSSFPEKEDLEFWESIFREYAPSTFE